MSDLQLDLNNIEPILSQNTFKLFETELINILGDVAEEYNLDKEKLTTKYLPNILNLSIKLGVKKRTKRVLPKELQCMGRKIDGEQCTRSRRNGCDYCLSHSKRLPHGRIDDNTYVKKEKGKRGRKRKSIESEYIATKLEIINGKEYLVDEYDNVFKYDLNQSEFLGTKQDILNTAC